MKTPRSASADDTPGAYSETAAATGPAMHVEERRTRAATPQTIFFDESGNTGGDLTHREQPVFVLASHKIAEVECAALLRAHFGQTQAAEIKFANVRKHPKSQQALLAFLRTVYGDGAPIASFAVHKRFALFQRLFDYLVEPVLHERGVEIAEEAINIHLTNAGYLLIERSLGALFTDRLLNLFQEAVRQSSPALLTQVWAHLERGVKRRPGVTRWYLKLLLAGRLAHRDAFDRLTLKELDVAFSTTVALMAYWRRDSEGPFFVMHDQTKPLAQYREVWDWLTSPEQQRATLGFGDYRDLPLPLNVERTEIARSHDHKGLQVADLLAGSLMEIGRFRAGDGSNEFFAQQLVEAGADKIVNNIWPEAGWKPPEDEGAGGEVSNPLDFLAEAMAKGQVRPLR